MTHQEKTAMTDLNNPYLRNALLPPGQPMPASNVLVNPMTHLPRPPTLGPAGQASYNYLRDVVTGENLRQGLENYRNAFLNVAQAGLSGQPLTPEAEAAMLDVFPGGGLAGITAFHGSPHLFEKFNLGKIGTGEGAQTYGHGLYFAENPEVAKSYERAAMSHGITIKGKSIIPENYQINQIVANTPDNKSLRKELIDYIDEHKTNPYADISSAKKIINAIDENTFSRGASGHIYKVDIPDKYTKNFLDWDKPIGKNVASKIPKKQRAEWNALLKEAGQPQIEEMTGSHLYSFIGDMVSEGKIPSYTGNMRIDASEYLNKLGIKGIRYLDQGSRAAGEGSRNFVVFDDKIIQMLERNNEPMLPMLRPQAGFSPEMEAQIAREAEEAIRAGEIPAIFKVQAE